MDTGQRARAEGEARAVEGRGMGRGDVHGAGRATRPPVVTTRLFIVKTFISLILYCRALSATECQTEHRHLFAIALFTCVCSRAPLLRNPHGRRRDIGGRREARRRLDALSALDAVAHLCLRCPLGEKALRD